ncbi:MAG: hypothetical protein CVV31_07190 [Methanomicrobiales archaeon HGW-Methanomicrobiales-2]|jgi:hypothetical protein|nr:MAG: hypothetical protein CVV31_07190 [Methanomicrobiales archaeon HGW-Methanomicrobiales-2]
MFEEGDIECIKKLLLPAKRVLKAGPQIRYETFERRIELWNQIRTNFDRYQDGECGTFLRDLDSHFRSQFDAALVALAVSVKANGESFDAVRIFSDEELGLYERVERYNVFELLTVNDIKKRLIRQDENLLSLLHDYYIEMDSWVDASLENTEIRLTLRGYLKKRWGGYKGKANAAVAEAVTELDWLGGLIATWKDEAQSREKSVRSEVEAEKEAQSRRLKEKEAILRDQEREVIRREEEAQGTMASARKIEEDARAARDNLVVQEQAIRVAEEALTSREQRIEAAMRALKGNGQGERSRYVSAGEAKQYELTFIGRMERKIGDSPVIGGRAFYVEGIEENRGTSAGYAGEARKKVLPENRSLTIRLVEKRLLGRKKQYVFDACYASRIERYADLGYDCDPLAQDDVTAMLADMRDQTRSSGIVTVLCLASPTGFERRVRDFIDSEQFHRNFISKYLSVLLLDMETGDLAFNPADETAQAFSDICELEIDSEKVAKVRRDVEKAMLDALKLRDHVVFDDIQKALGNGSLMKSAFYDCATEMGGEVQFVEGVGLVMMRG